MKVENSNGGTQFLVPRWVSLSLHYGEYYACGSDTLILV